MTQAQFQQRPTPITTPISKMMQAPTPDDVLTALSAFPAPPSHIPASPAASIATVGSYFSLPTREGREGREGRDAPPSAFGARRMRSTGTGGGAKRRDSATSVQSAQSGKLSVLVNGQDVEYDSGTEWDERDGKGRRDSGSGSSARSGISSAFSMGIGGGGAPASPTSERFYYTAPSTPLPPGTPSAGPSSNISPGGSVGSLSAYPHSPSSSPYPYAYSTDYPYTYPHSSTSPASAYAPSSARTALAMLSTSTVSTSISASSSGSLSATSPSSSSLSSTSGSPASIRVPVSAVGSGTGAGMSPIEEREERPRRDVSSRRGSLSQQQNVIGGPPSVPLPPIPSTPRSQFNSTYSDLSNSTPTQLSRTAVPMKSLPSLHSASSGRNSHSNLPDQGHAQRESVVSVMSSGSGMSAFSSVAPSLAEFGVARRIDLGMKEDNSENGYEDSWSRESTIEAGDVTLGMNGDGEEREGMRWARTPRAGASLRIDIPSPYAQEKERIRIQESQLQLQQRKSVVSASSLSSDLEREKDEIGTKVQSPTTSLFSVASEMTSRSAMSSAQSLRTRVSGMLDGLGKVPEPVPSPASPSTSVGKEEGKGQYTKSIGLRPATSSTSMSSSANINAIGKSASNNLLTTEDLSKDPLLARAVTPITPLDNSSIARGTGPSPSPLEMSNMSRTYNAMRLRAESPLMVPSSAQAPLLLDTDTDTDGNESDLPGTEVKLSPGILGQFPTTPTMSARPPPSSFPFPGSNSRLSPAVASGTGPTGESASSSPTSILRTMSQSRRKPLPPAPRPLHTSLPSISSIGSRKNTGRRDSSSRPDIPASTYRGRSQSGRGDDDDGATSPDIVSMMCSTPRPISRSKSMSARSSLSTRSPSSRSSSVKSYARNHARPSLPDERERDAALARFSVNSSSSSKAPSMNASKARKDLSTHQSSEHFMKGGIEGDDDDADPDESMDYGIAIARHRGGYDLSPSLMGVSEALDVDELDGLQTTTDGREFYAEEAQAMLGHSSPEHVEDESDSDIDLHTPLPHILLREGVLHPHSKVLASSGLLSVRSSFMGSGRDSVLSNDTHASFGSSLTKSGLFKDARNTDGRRRRHRDGKNLRGGLGLTTGLGWSDSEDEDAPSPFTNRLSAMDLSRNTSMSSFQSSSKKQSQLLTRSTPASAPTSRTSSTYSGHPNLNSSRSSRVPMRESAAQSLSKSHSTANLSGKETGSYTRHASIKPLNDESRSMSPTSSSSASLPFPPTPRDELYDDSDASMLSGSMVRKLSNSRASSIRAKTPTRNSVKASQSTSQLRSRVTSGPKSAPPSHLPSVGMSTPRPLRLPALQLQQKEALVELQVKEKRQPGQPARSGTLLGYNRNLHDRQRAQHLVASTSSPASPPSPLSPALSSQSAPSSTLAYPTRGTYGTIPASALRPPVASMSRVREPSPSRLSAPATSIGKPRTGTGMVYRQSSLPPSRVGSTVGRPAVI